MGIVLAVLINGERAQQEDKLRRLGVLDDFDAGVAASGLSAFNQRTGLTRYAAVTEVFSGG